MTGRLLRARDRAPVPWRNGGGWTSEVACEPDPAIDDFTWRISVATIEGDSAFSIFPGVHRALMPLSPAGLTLDFGATAVHVQQFGCHEFAGEDHVRSSGVAARSFDLNLMVRREVADGILSSQGVDGLLAIPVGERETVVVIALAGVIAIEDSAPEHHVTLEHRITLELHDAVELHGSSTFTGVGTIAIARIRPISAAV